MTIVHQVNEIEYPDSDGLPMSDNTRQFQWIVLVKENLDALLLDFVAGDLLWYPVEGRPDVRMAPDTMVAVGRPKGYRGSYKQWEEDGIAPQVAFEVLSPKNTLKEMDKKRALYEQYGVLEFYIIDPEVEVIEGFRRASTRSRLRRIPSLRSWTSPLMNIRFETEQERLVIYRPDGEPFISFDALMTQRDQERQRRQQAEAAAAQQQHQADQQQRRADQQQRRADRLAAQLRALGIEPEE